MADIDFEYIDEALINPDLICSICQSPFNNPYSTPYKHCYCKECIIRCLQGSNKCPLCNRSPIKLADLVKDETVISHAIKRLFVACKKCGRSNIYLEEFDDHINHSCPKILLYSHRKEGSSLDRHNSTDSDRSIMNQLELLITPLMRQNKQLTEELQRQKTLINELNNQINVLKSQTTSIESIKQTTLTHQTKIEELENRIERCNDNSIENKSEISSLWEKIDRKLNELLISLFIKNFFILELTPHENYRLENYINENCRFGAEFVLRNKQITDHDVEIIVKKAIINRQCSALDLTQNQITYKGASIIADTFQQNIRLKKLDLSHNELSDEGVQFLMETLLANTTLRELNLGSTGITNQGIIYLKEILQFNETLEKLDLFENDIDDDGMELVSDVLSKDNQTLVELSLHSNEQITDESVNSIIDLFRQSRSLKRIEIHKCDFSKGSKIRLRDAAENASISICI